MKPIKLFLALCLVATIGLFSSCDELKEALKTEFNFTGESIHIEIEPITATGEIQLLGNEDYNLDLAGIIQENASSFSIDNIREVNLTNIQIELLNGDEDNNFQNFELLYAEVYANEMPDRIVAEKLNIPNEKTMKMTIPIKDGSINLKDFVTKQSFGYNIQAKLRRSTTKILQAKITADYNFVVGM